MTANPVIDAFFDEATFTVTYLVSDPASRPRRDHRSGARLRPQVRQGLDGFGRPRARQGRASAGVTVDWILETHAHADHLTAAPHLKAKTGAKVVIGEHIREVQKIFKEVFNAADVSEDGREFDRLVRDGERLALGTLEIEVMHLPGHTPADVAYRIGDAVFVGDTIFMPDYGTARADFPGGDAATLYRSIRRLLSLPPRDAALHVPRLQGARPRPLRVGDHGGATNAPATSTSMTASSEAAFVALRTKRDATLAAPVLLLPSVQVNIRAGNLPPPTPTASAICAFPCGSRPDSRVAELASCIALR